MDILVVEDDTANANLINKLLKKQGYSVDVANTFREANNFIQSSNYHLIILDWNLPDKSGYELLEKIRALGIKSQVIMLSANSDVDYRVKALNTGADDYLCKPFSQVELLARVKSILRRTDSDKNTTITIGDVYLLKNTHEVKINDQIINLTTAEYDIFERMGSNPNKIFTKNELLNIVCSDYESNVMSNIIEVHISNLRKKLRNKEIIKTIRRVGYKIYS